MGRTLWCLATDVLVKILRGWRRGMNLRGENVTIDEGRSSGFKRAEGNDVRGKMV